WGYDTWLGADTAGADEGGDRADAARSDSPSYDRRRVGTTVLSGAPRRSLWHSRGTRGRTRSAHGSATLVETTGERWYESEIYRLKGALLLQQASDHQAEAESAFHHALEIARNQQAKSFELRIATSLTKLWKQQGKRQEAHDLLAPVYNWFTEGFDTADLKDAKALLEELEDGR